MTTNPDHPADRPDNQSSGGAAEDLVANEDQNDSGDDAVQINLAGRLAAAEDRLLRCQAELENYRKRARRELDEAVRYAGIPLFRELVPVRDNVQRAIDAASKTTDAESLLAGFRMLAQQLEEVFDRHGCAEIEALHAPFDPNHHEAISQQPSPDHPANTVISVLQPGYRVHDRVVRPSKVIVSTAAQDNPSE